MKIGVQLGRSPKPNRSARRPAWGAFPFRTGTVRNCPERLAENLARDLTRGHTTIEIRPRGHKVGQAPVPGSVVPKFWHWSGLAPLCSRRICVDA